MKILRDMVFANFKNKLTALIFAVTIYFVVNSQLSVEQRHELKVNIITRGATGAVNVGVRPDRVSVRVRGPRRALDQYFFQRTRSITLYIELEDEEGDRDIPVALTEKNLKSLPPEITVRGITPRNVVVSVTHQIKRRLRVAADVRGEPAAGYRVWKTLVDPSMVDVTGPRQALTGATTIPTTPVDLTGKDESFSITVPCAETLNNAAVICATPVKVTVVIRRRPVRKEMVLPVRLSIPPGFRYEVELAEESKRVTVEGPAPVLSGMRPGDVYLLVSISDKVNTRVQNRGPCELHGPGEPGALRLVEDVFVNFTAREKVKGPGGE